MKEQLHKYLEPFLFITLIFSFALAPQVKIIAGLPYFRIEDLLLPLVLGVLLLKSSFRKTNFLLLLGVFAVYELLVIAINGRLGMYRDYFEIYESLKLSVLVLFFMQSDLFKLDKLLRISFYLLAVFNLLHYFDLLGVNTLLKEVYNAGIHLDTFGLDSLGNPSAKRMIGTALNPNINAILMLFYIFYFFPKELNGKMLFPFLLSFLLFLMCQSRTGIIAFVVAYFLQLKLFAPNWRYVGLLTLSLLLTYGVYFMIDNMYIAALATTDIQNIGSVKGRLEVWQELWPMIQENILFGHGPSKEFFESRELYAESEYVLVAFRYGIIGVGLYLSLMLLPFWNAMKDTTVTYARLIIPFSLIVLITAITNNPLSDPRILAIFALTIGLFYNSNGKAETKA